MNWVKIEKDTEVKTGVAVLIQDKYNNYCAGEFYRRIDGEIMFSTQTRRGYDILLLSEIVKYVVID